MSTKITIILIATFVLLTVASGKSITPIDEPIDGVTDAATDADGKTSTTEKPLLTPEQLRELNKKTLQLSANVGEEIDEIKAILAKMKKNLDEMKKI